MLLDFDTPTFGPNFSAYTQFIKMVTQHTYLFLRENKFYAKNLMIPVIPDLMVGNQWVLSRFYAIS